MPSDTLSRVLCVDDDEDAGEMLSSLLKSQRIEITCARSAAEAWLKIKAECFDLYLLDGWLPDLDGFEFCRQLREFNSNTPILFYSGAAYDADKQKGLAAGANAYVIKPDLEGLIETMVDLIAKARAGDVAAPWVSHERDPAREMAWCSFFSVDLTRFRKSVKWLATSPHFGVSVAAHRLWRHPTLVSFLRNHLRHWV